MTLAVLPNFPFLDQLTEKSLDGYPVDNARFDCVPCSFAAAIEYYTGQHVTGQELKDAEYGATYANSGTALRRYIDDASDLARAKYHVTAVSYSSPHTASLVSRTHSWLQAGYPVIATIPSQWGIAHDQATLDNPPFSTHVICFYGEIAGGLEAMNPWHGVNHQGSDEYWQGRLCEGQIWAVVRETEAVTATIPTGWKDDGKTLTAPNGVQIVQGFRDYVLAHSWAANNTPLAPERVVSAGSIEYGNASVGPGSRQDFRFCSLGWTQAWGVYVIAVGQDVTALVQQLAAQQAQVASLTKQLATAQATITAEKPDPVAQAALRALQAVKAALGEL